MRTQTIVGCNSVATIVILYVFYVVLDTHSYAHIFKKYAVAVVEYITWRHMRACECIYMYVLLLFLLLLKYRTHTHVQDNIASACVT